MAVKLQITLSDWKWDERSVCIHVCSVKCALLVMYGAVTKYVNGSSTNRKYNRKMLVEKRKLIRQTNKKER